ncbi:hypothetical protein ACNI3K_01730 [Demequina sp. SO4-13]|uniref:hypothetical protein n=1 Tax=Demequina sp. SO4-13 TaxID=3401027 RepID=UPI003AF5A818
MRAVAAAISGVYALLVMAIALPWDEAECARMACETSDADAQIFPLGFTIAALAIPTLVVMIILRAVLGFRSTRDPEAGAVLAALGQTRGPAMRIAALQGLRDGAIAMGGAYVAAGAIHVAMLVGTGLNPITTGSEHWAARAVLALMVLLALVVPHVLAAAQRPRTPVDALTADMEDEVAPRPSLGRRAMLSAGLLALAGGVIAGLAISMRDTPWTEVGFVAKNAAGIAMIVGWASVLVLAFWAIVPWLRSRRSAATSLAAKLVGRDTGVGAVLASYAGDRSRASARIVTVLAGLGFLIAALPSHDPYPAMDDRLLMTTIVEGDVDAAALEAEYRDIEGVDRVITTDAAIVDPNDFGNFVFAVSPGSLRGREDALADVLERHPQAVAAQLWNGEAPTGLLASGEFEAAEVVPIATCCGAFVNADHVQLESPGVGFLIYATEDADWDATIEAVNQIETPEASAAGSSTSGATSAQPLWNVAVNLMLAFVVLGLPLTLLAVGAVRRRRRDDATLTALGATAHTMRTAIAIDTAVVSGFALAGGMAVGVVTRILMTALQQGRLSLGPIVVDAPLMVGFDSVAWGPIAVVGVASVVIMTLVAFITARVTGRRTGAPAGSVGRVPTSREPAPLP